MIFLNGATLLFTSKYKLIQSVFKGTRHSNFYQRLAWERFLKMDLKFTYKEADSMNSKYLRKDIIRKFIESTYFLILLSLIWILLRLNTPKPQMKIYYWMLMWFIRIYSNTYLILSIVTSRPPIDGHSPRRHQKLKLGMGEFQL